ncbi:MAG: hypothetical protein R3D58_17310, partial [Saprospiraceae bacterium]
MKNYLPVRQLAQWISAVRRYRRDNQPASKTIRYLVFTVVIGLAATGLFRLIQPVDSSTTRVAQTLSQTGRHWIGEAGVRIAAAKPLGHTQFTHTRVPVEIDGRKSIQKVVGIHPEHDDQLDAEMVFVYEDADLNGLDEEELILYSSADNGKTWDPHRNSVVDPERNTILLKGIAHFSLWTAAAAPPPGCSVPAPLLWMRPESGIAVSDGQTVQQWDNSANPAYNLTQGTAGARPTYYNTTADNLLNFNPSLSFDGGDELRNTTRMYNQTDPFHLFVVAKDKRTVLGQLRAPMGIGADGNYPTMDMQTDGVSPNGWNPWMTGSSPAEWNGGSALLFNGNTGGSNAQPQLLSLSSANGGSNNIVSYVDGFTETTTLDANNQVQIGNGIFVGSSGGEQWLGLISEVIVYNQQLSGTDLQKVESYLALKYGITLDQRVAENYVAGNGTVLWDATVDAAYSNNIAGIGREDCQFLDQRQSQSANGGIQPLVGNGNTIATTNAGNSGTFGSDASYMLWGSTNAAAVFGTAYAFSGMSHRLDRIWKVRETGSVGSVKVALPANRIPGTATSLHLLVSNDATFDNADQKIAMNTENIGGVDYYVATVDFNSGQHYSFGAYVVSPGCVTANLLTWYKASHDVTGDPVSAWGDLVNGYDVIQATANHRPTLESAVLNFNPAILFDGGDDHLEYTAGRFISTTSSGTMFGAATNSGDGGYENLADLGIDNPHMGKLNSQQIMWMNSSSPVQINQPGNYSTDRSHIWGYFWNGGGPNVGSGLRLDGTELYDPTTEATSVASGGYVDGLWTIGSYNGIETWDGHIGEIILYDRNLAAWEKDKVESYLGIKYGNTLTHNYYAGDWNGTTGTTLWTTGGGYDNSIAGIGRDDCQGLEQKQSRSANPGFQPVIGNAAELASSNAAHSGSFGSDGSFLLWGANSGATTFGTAYNFSGMSHRIDRIWKTQETGSVGSVKVGVEASTFPGNASQIHLLVSNDATFDNADQKIAMSLETVGSVSYYTATVDFSSTQHFTFGAFLTAPGCVAANLLTWYKASNGVTGDPVSAWQDAVNGYDVIQNNAAHRPAFQSAAMNFNPALLFDGGNDHLEYTAGRFIATNASGTMFGAATNAGDGGYENLADLGIDNPHMGKLNAQQIMWMNGSGPVQIVQPGNFATDRSHVWGYFWNGGGPNVGSGLRLNGTEFYDPTTEATLVANSGYVDGLWTIGAYDGIETWNGLISEIILYDRNLAVWEKDKVETYLAVKYGNTLTHNYYAGDWNGATGTTLWTTGGGYDNDIAGIGRDDCQGLLQKQSQSVNPGSLVAIYLGDQTSGLPVDNSSNASNFAADQRFMLWGSNGSSSTFGTAYTPNSFTPAAGYYRMARIWRVKETGTVGTVTVSIPANTQAEHLLVHSSANFGTGTPVEIPLTNNGNGQMVATVDLTDGQYFTFGRTLYAPGCVAANLLTWYKATDGVTGDPVSAWQDLANGYNVIQNNAAHRPAFQSAAMNFNPALLFDGGDDHLEYTAGRFIATNASGTMFGAATNAGDGGYENLADLGIDNPHMGKLNAQQIMWMNGSGPVQIVQPGNFATDRSHVWGYFWNGGGPNVGSGLRLNGTEFFDPNTEATLVANSGYVDGLWTIGAYDGIETWNGLIGEIILYDRNLALWEKHKVETYLAIKYGNTLTHNYYAGDWNGTTGTTIWTTGGGYDNDIAGIGRDNCQALHQKQSRSVNPDDIVTIGHVTIAADNAGNTNAMTDGTFMLWGNNDAAAAFNTA